MPGPARQGVDRTREQRQALSAAGTAAGSHPEAVRQWTSLTPAPPTP
ncbi:hypothetical protein ACFVHW_11365 [Streptomyces sp. NPDC127110]